MRDGPPSCRDRRPSTIEVLKLEASPTQHARGGNPVRRDEDPNSPGQQARDTEDEEGSGSGHDDAGGEGDQEAMEPDLGTTG
jgi:hypothetical protein